MAPQLTADETDELLYFSRANEKEDLISQLQALAEREKVSPAEILTAARDEGKSTCLHMATGNGHIGGFLAPRGTCGRDARPAA